MSNATYFIIASISIACSAKTDGDKRQVFRDGSTCNCDSLNRIFDDIGTLVSETAYKNGQKNGVHKLYDDKGNLMSQAVYKNGKKNGIEILYASDLIVAEIPYQNGKIHGTQVFYNEEGRGVYFARFENGIMLGKPSCASGKSVTSPLECY